MHLNERRQSRGEDESMPRSLPPTVIALGCVSLPMGHLRGTAFGLYDFGIGLATLMASTIAGILWAAAGAGAAFGIGAAVAMLAVSLLLLNPKPVVEHAARDRSERS
jgi:MFS family permease